MPKQWVSNLSPKPLIRVFSLPLYPIPRFSSSYPRKTGTEYSVLAKRTIFQMGPKVIAKFILGIAWLFLLTTPVLAEEDSETDIAQQLSNPVAALISVPIQMNYDSNFGLDDGGTIVRINVQPVIPISISDEWNLISRTILPIIDQNDFPFDGYSEFGLGDTVQSFFFSPKAPTSGGWIWGAGPVLLAATATDEFLGSEKWGIGPTAVVLKQSGPWTFGALANHIESFAGESDRADISATFLQPFVTYVTPKQTTWAFNTESTYDWENRKWAVPLNITVSQLLRRGNQLVQIGGGVRYWATAPDGGPEGWGFRLQLTLLYPK